MFRIKKSKTTSFLISPYLTFNTSINPAESFTSRIYLKSIYLKSPLGIRIESGFLTWFTWFSMAQALPSSWTFRVATTSPCSWCFRHTGLYIVLEHSRCISESGPLQLLLLLPGILSPRSSHGWLFLINQVSVKMSSPQRKFSWKLGLK